MTRREGKTGSEMVPAGGPEPGPPLPLSPMDESRSRVLPDLPLPNETGPLIGIAACVGGAGAAGMAVLLAGIRSLDAFANLLPWMLCATLMGLGAWLVDRYRGHVWPRSRRWAVGMGLRGLLPVVTLLALPLWVGPPPQSRHLAAFPIEMVSSALGCACLGWLLAEASRSGKGLLWKLPLTGLYAGAAAALVLYVAKHAWFEGWWWGSPYPLHVEYSDLFVRPLTGALIGLSLALLLGVAHRKGVSG